MEADPAHAPDRRIDPHSFEAAIYGTIIATALVAAQRHETPRDIVVTLLGATVVLWLAHMWTGLVVGRVEHGPRFSRAKVAELFHQERALLTSGLLPALIVALAWVDWVERDTAVAIAVVAGLVELTAWGFYAARASETTIGARLVAGLVYGALGVGIVALEIVASH
ncbi:MAG: hypothetical protein JWN72_995 [Thermoleophilia bacterium]|nr:hypothetical protein [Thermoleophilia bacterium]